MILFTILLLTLAVLAVIILGVIGIFGAGTIIVFGDAIVCTVFIILIMRAIIRSRRRR